MTREDLQAYQEFMLRGSSSQPITEPSRSSESQRQSARKYQTMFQAFHGTLTRDWYATDDNLHSVMSSIASRRERIRLESKELNLREQQSDDGGEES